MFSQETARIVIASLRHGLDHRRHVGMMRDLRCRTFSQLMSKLNNVTPSPDNTRSDSRQTAGLVNVVMQPQLRACKQTNQLSA